jgi:hypothetical protein
VLNCTYHKSCLTVRITSRINTIRIKSRTTPYASKIVTYHTYLCQTTRITSRTVHTHHKSCHITRITSRINTIRITSRTTPYASQVVPHHTHHKSCHTTRITSRINTIRIKSRTTPYASKIVTYHTYLCQTTRITSRTVHTHHKSCHTIRITSRATSHASQVVPHYTHYKSYQYYTHHKTYHTIRITKSCLYVRITNRAFMYVNNTVLNCTQINPTTHRATASRTTTRKRRAVPHPSDSPATSHTTATATAAVVPAGSFLNHKLQKETGIACHYQQCRRTHNIPDNSRCYRLYMHSTPHDRKS